MFVEAELEWTVLVKPDAMKSPLHVQRGVILALVKDFNDLKCTPRGYCVALDTIESIGEGRLWERRGCIAFPVRFRCLMFTLVKQEFVLAVVKEVNANGICCDCGPVEKLWVAEDHLRGDDLDYPVYRFVGQESSAGGYAHWIKSATETEIKLGDVLRVKILGTQWNPETRNVDALGTLVDDYAGIDTSYPNDDAAPLGKDIRMDNRDGEPANQWDVPVGLAEDDNVVGWD